MPDPIAVIGLGCRFPGATTPDELWQLLADGRETASEPLPHADEFDAGFFRVRPAEAAALDPQHRVLLECAWEAVEHAGYDPTRLVGPVGVFAGGYANGVDAPDYLASRVSYKLDLTGPSLGVQTACSTSLVAIHLACQALRADECRTALAGGVTVRVAATESSIYSADGHCRAFDAAADGAGPGDGAGVVVLKRLADAQADGDTIHAVVLGSATGNDGANRVGFTAPGAAGQAEIVRRALARSGVGADTIGYVEAHGSGTPIGDRIEVEALRRAFGDVPGPCLLGSVKTNLGHTHAAAGVAGFLKAVLALRHRVIPASLHYREPNPMIDFAAFRVAAVSSSWPGSGPLRAGVSSFGQGGTGAHVVLQEAPVFTTTDPGGTHVLTLSARTPEALTQARERLADHLSGHPELPIADVAYTLREGRKSFAHEVSLAVSSTEDAVRVLRDPDAVPAVGVGDGIGRRVPLPTYPFQRRRFASSPRV